MNVLAALAFALAGIYVRGDRVLPIGYAPAWDPKRPTWRNGYPAVRVLRSCPATATC